MYPTKQEVRKWACEFVDELTASFLQMVDKVYNSFGYLGDTFTGLSWDDEPRVQAMVVDRVQSEEHLPLLQKGKLSANEKELYWLLQSVVHDVVDDDRQWDTVT